MSGGGKILNPEAPFCDGTLTTGLVWDLSEVAGVRLKTVRFKLELNRPSI
jgi:hypothetical protein